ncbi:3513_t:CDS:2 [Acaulospora colombiana]|uniref:3513_t:CDS:1 n=1 Tax=Acaulospora colombiana TaxID=27376 RepID=A0ACA9LV41_9GLOM|nr:3513_t:CDS:2 [Acaulospora colombiana]
MTFDGRSSKQLIPLTSLCVGHFAEKLVLLAEKMSKLVATTIGLITSAALLYNFQSDIESNTTQIRKMLHKSQSQLEAALPTHLKSDHYVKHRLIPTFKSTWNAHVETFAHKVCNFDASETAKAAVKSAKSFSEEKGWK